MKPTITPKPVDVFTSMSAHLQAHHYHVEQHDARGVVHATSTPEQDAEREEMEQWRQAVRYARSGIRPRKA